ncbi:hypothetical protein ACCO45_011796 [Purpureocillium lilacinum]|uniref:Uncharacterized protein n=1 Tax=Purpureocillium lilacinum TaxID=33203 RepID=A0ACC4DET4_PURLI
MTTPPPSPAAPEHGRAQRASRITVAWEELVQGHIANTFEQHKGADSSVRAGRGRAAALEHVWYQWGGSAGADRLSPAERVVHGGTEPRDANATTAAVQGRERSQLRGSSTDSQTDPTTSSSSLNTRSRPGTPLNAEALEFVPNVNDTDPRESDESMMNAALHPADTLMATKGNPTVRTTTSSRDGGTDSHAAGGGRAGFDCNHGLKYEFAVTPRR